jgi:hypothetical protein
VSRVQCPTMSRLCVDVVVDVDVDIDGDGDVNLAGER